MSEHSGIHIAWQQADSINLAVEQVDSVPVQPVISTESDSVIRVESVATDSMPAEPAVIPARITIQPEAVSVPQSAPEELSGRMPRIIFSEPAKSDSASMIQAVKMEDMDRVLLFRDNDSVDFASRPQPFFTAIRKSHPADAYLLTAIPHVVQRSALNWTLVIGFTSIFLLLALKTYYRKLVSQVASTLVNFQLAEKLYREKNIIVRRAFMLLNLNFILVVSLFVLLMALHWDIVLTGRHISDYFLITGMIVLVLAARMIIFYIAGFLLEKIPPVLEHIHLIYLVNKNIGLVLLPLSFIVIYAPPGISNIALFAGIGILILATVYKLFRGFQIILRGGFFLFYAILYLCTLELLPLAIGSKLIISLR